MRFAMSFLFACCLVITAVVCTAQAQQVNCLVDADWGKIDLTQIPQHTFLMLQAEGQNHTYHYFKFNLCTPTTVPPAGAENCHTKALVGQWTTGGKCEAQFDTVSLQPKYIGDAVTIQYKNQQGWTASVKIKCGTEPLFPGPFVGVDENDYEFPLESQYVCPPPKCILGPFHLRPIPHKAFTVEVAEPNGSSTQHVVQLSLCAPSSKPPSNADSCGVAAYYGEWSATGKCEAQFDTLSAPSVFNGTHAIMYFSNKKSPQQHSTVYLGCGTNDLDVISVARNSHGYLSTVATSKYACAATCSVLTPRGKVDLSRIPETVLPMFEDFEGKHIMTYWRFSMCRLSATSPKGGESCGSSYIGQWSNELFCMLQYDKVHAVSNDDDVTVLSFASTSHENTVTIRLRCGESPLAAVGDVTRIYPGHVEMSLSSMYACV